MGFTFYAVCTKNKYTRFLAVISVQQIVQENAKLLNNTHETAEQKDKS
jgi:hypothetical protein